MYTAPGAICFILLFSAVHMFNMFQKDPNTFGPYDITWRRYDLCRGPKSKNSTIFFTSLQKQGNYSVGIFNLTFLVDTSLDEVKIVVYSLKNNTKNLLWTYKITDPCQHFAFGSIIFKFLNTRDCVVRKDSFYFSLNFDETSHSFMGTSFFYGEFWMKITVTSKKANVMCIICEMKFSKEGERKIN